MSDSENKSEAKYTEKDLERERGYAQHFEVQLNDLKNRFKGIDPDQYAKDKADLEALKNDRAAKSGDPKQLEERLAEAKRELEDAYATKLREVEGRANSAETDLRNERATKPVLRKIASMVTGEDQAQLLEPIIKNEADFQDGRIVFKGADGKPRRSKDRPAEFMGEEEFAAELKTRFPGSFKSDAIPGARNGAQQITTINGAEIRSMADAARLPDKGVAFFKQLAMTKEGEVRLKQIMNTPN